MIKGLQNYWKARKNPKVLLEASIDHVEVGNKQVFIGLNLAWHNETPEAIPVQDIQVTLFPHGPRKKGIHFKPYQHFVRAPGQKVIEKMTEQKEIVLEAKADHREYIRFVTNEVADLPVGTYPAQVHCLVSEGTYVNEMSLEITSGGRYRTSEAWA